MKVFLRSFFVFLPLIEMFFLSFLWAQMTSIWMLGFLGWAVFLCAEIFYPALGRSIGWFSVSWGAVLVTSFSPNIAFIFGLLAFGFRFFLYRLQHFFLSFFKERFLLE